MRFLRWVISRLFMISQQIHYRMTTPFGKPKNLTQKFVKLTHIDSVSRQTITSVKVKSEALKLTTATRWQSTTKLILHNL